MKDFLFVIIQFSCLLALFYLYLESFDYYHSILFLFAALPGILALWEMRTSHFSVFPKPQKDATLLDTGVYSKIRHPMYTSVIAGGIILTIYATYSTIALAVLLILFVNQVFKARYEERLLSAQFTNYTAYQKRTKMFVPSII